MKRIFHFFLMSYRRDRHAREEAAVGVLSVRRRLGDGSCPKEKVVVNGDPSKGGTIATCFVVKHDRGDEGHIFMRSKRKVHARTFSPSGLASPDLVVCTPIEMLKGGAVMAGKSRASAVCRKVSGRLAFRRSLHSERFRPSNPGCAPHVSNIVRVRGNGFGCTVSVLGDGGKGPSDYGECAFTCRGPMTNRTRFVRACVRSNGPLPDFRKRPGLMRTVSGVRRFTSLL